MSLGPKTELCLSLSERPGSTGAFIQNTLSEHFQLDRVYLPRQVKRGDLSAAILGIRALAISGFAVSSPFKQEVIAHLDHVAMHAAVTRSVNTVVNDAGMLIGHSTDGDGFRLAYGKMLEDEHIGVAVVLGTGPAARAVMQALGEMGISAFAYSRPGKNYDIASSVFPGSTAHLSLFTTDSAGPSTVLVNATSERDSVLHWSLTPQALGRYAAFIDINVGETAMVRAARVNTRIVHDGLRMAVAQSLLQFELWTGITLDDHERELEHMLGLLQKEQR